MANVKPTLCSMTLILSLWKRKKFELKHISAHKRFWNKLSNEKKALSNVFTLNNRNEKKNDLDIN